MKRTLFALFTLITTIAFAEFVQFTGADYNYFTTAQTYTEQGWIPANMIALSVKANTSVYISNYVSSWYGEMPNLGDTDYLAGYDMSANSYGYVYAEKDANGLYKPVGDIHYANGTTKEVTYKNPNGPQQRTTTGYYLDTFTKDAEIFLVMTPNGYTDEVNSWYPVNDPYGAYPYSSILASRQINTYDLTGQTRVNFGTVDGVAHEFVVGYEAEPITGQPLPGVMMSCLVGIGVILSKKK